MKEITKEQLNKITKGKAITRIYTDFHKVLTNGDFDDEPLPMIDDRIIANPFAIKHTYYIIDDTHIMKVEEWSKEYLAFPFEPKEGSNNKFTTSIYVIA